MLKDTLPRAETTFPARYESEWGHTLRRYRLPLLALTTFVFGLLFFGDFLTGRQHLVFQDPYSRMTRVIERKYGLQSQVQMQSNCMSDYYFNTLKQKATVYNWQTAPNTFRIERFTGRRVEETAPVAPIIDVNPEDEKRFLESLPGNHIRVMVIRSLFLDRAPPTDPDAAQKNGLRMTEEKRRMETLVHWAEYDSKDAVTAARWWHLNAAKFGLDPDGNPLPPAKPAPQK